MKKAAPATDTPVPPTSRVTLAILILVLLCLVAATFKACFYPSQPATWEPLHHPGSISAADVNRILSESGALIDSLKHTADSTTESWTRKHRTGDWSILVRIAKKPAGDLVESIQIRSDITHFPSFTRTFDYPAPAAIAPAK